MMNISVLLTFLIYLSLLFGIAYLTSRSGSSKGTENFFLAGRTAPWWIVAIGMIGDTISGVTFVSVPGMVGTMDMTYLQLCIGFFFGYIIVAYVLLPLYYRLGVTSIYTYLEQRFGMVSYRTGAFFFIISKMFGAAAKLYLITMILHGLVSAPLGIPFPVTAVGIVAIIWLYTRQGGMGTILWTDVLQTVSLVLALVVIIWQVMEAMDLDFAGLVETIQTSPHSRIWEWSDPWSKLYAPKQLLSGAFIVVVMTGLDQNMMQKNLTCSTLGEARKNMLSYGFGFIPLNYLFLVLGILLLAYAQHLGIELPPKGDDILPHLVGGHLGTLALVCFTLGITAASFSNADSALTSLTTSVCVDLLGIEKQDQARGESFIARVHLAICVLFALVILLIGFLQQSSVLTTIYTAVSYTYGPLLGLFAFGMFTLRRVIDRRVPVVCLLSPILCYLVQELLARLLLYQVGYEILLLNGGFTILGLWLISQPKESQLNV